MWLTACIAATLLLNKPLRPQRGGFFYAPRRSGRPGAARRGWRGRAACAMGWDARWAGMHEGLLQPVEKAKIGQIQPHASSVPSSAPAGRNTPETSLSTGCAREARASPVATAHRPVWGEEAARSGDGGVFDGESDRARNGVGCSVGSAACNSRGAPWPRVYSPPLARAGSYALRLGREVWFRSAATARPGVAYRRRSPAGRLGWLRCSRGIATAPRRAGSPQGRRDPRTTRAVLVFVDGPA